MNKEQLREFFNSLPEDAGNELNLYDFAMFTADRIAYLKKIDTKRYVKFLEEILK